MLRGKTAIITGASRGIGRAVLEEFARCGSNIIACVRHQNEDFDDFLKKLSADFGIHADIVIFDITDCEAMKSAIRALAAQKRDIDILVNCAGVAHGGLFQMTPVSKIREIFEVNLFAQMELTQMVLKMMSRKKGGCILNFASILGLDNYGGQCAYGASKAALIKWTQTLAVETGAMDIRANVIAPGLTETDMGLMTDAKTSEKMLEHSAVGRRATPSDVAKIAAFLASDAAKFINGSVIRTDGGFVL